MSRWKPKVNAFVIPRIGDPASAPWKGRYQDLAVDLLKATDAEGVLLLVLMGNRGTGFQSAFRMGASISDADVPRLLRTRAHPAAAPLNGSYQDFTVELMGQVEAEAVILIVLTGDRGDAFQSAFKLGGRINEAKLPELLRVVAHSIDAARGTRS
jgi:hypothetical protein